MRHLVLPAMILALVLPACDRRDTVGGLSFTLPAGFTDPDGEVHGISLDPPDTLPGSRRSG
ncbi:MAG: hypothetical protein JF615_05795 [Asticcacaulis sp.]|nr:hypothetical protein [Asticcacaulis sp.]